METQIAILEKIEKLILEAIKLNNTLDRTLPEFQYCMGQTTPSYIERGLCAAHSDTNTGIRSLRNALVMKQIEEKS